MEGERLLLIGGTDGCDDGVSGVVSSSASSTDVRLSSENVYELAFTLVAPLGAEYHSNCNKLLEGFICHCILAKLTTHAGVQLSRGEMNVQRGNRVTIGYEKGVILRSSQVRCAFIPSSGGPINPVIGSFYSETY